MNLAYAMTRGLRRAAIDDAGVVNVSGEAATLGFFDDTLNGDLTNGSPIIDGISGDPAVAGWLGGMSISTREFRREAPLSRSIQQLRLRYRKTPPAASTTAPSPSPAPILGWCHGS